MAQRSLEQLAEDVQFALSRGLGARDLVPMLGQLVGLAPADSDVGRFARIQLGLQVIESNPFRAVALARSVTSQCQDDEAFGLLGLALTLLGCFRAAAKAHRRACEIAPDHPGHLHNLGHLLDAALGRPREGLPWLRLAFRQAPDVPGIASSYAHSLVRVGRVDEARNLLHRHVHLDEQLVESTLRQWLVPPLLARDAS